MKVTLNPEEKGIMRTYGKINLKCFLPEEFYGHYYIEFEKDTAYVKAKKRGYG